MQNLVRLLFRHGKKPRDQAYYLTFEPTATTGFSTAVHWVAVMQNNDPILIGQNDNYGKYGGH